MARIQLEPAYVLHTRAFRETSMIVEAFSRAHGRVAVVARGAKSPRSIAGLISAACLLAAANIWAAANAPMGYVGK